MQKKWQIGINIQPNKLHGIALLADKAKSHWQLKQYWSINQDMSQPESILAGLKTIRKMIPRHHSVRTLLPDSSVLQQTIELPTTPLNNIELAWFVEASVTKQFPFALHELAVDYRKTADNTNQIIITAARKSEIDNWYNLFHQANLNLDVIDIESSISQFMLKISQLSAQEFSQLSQLDALNISDPEKRLKEPLNDLYLAFGLALRWSDY